jgi:ParB-like chromosome segregation protein Spo0J
MAKPPAKLDKPFRDRIVGHGTERVDQMLANPLNFRIHPDNQQQALAGSIDDIGFIRSVTVNQRTGRVVDGHLRVTLAARSGVENLPVEYVDLDEAEEAQALLSLDPIAAMAAADRQKLDELLHQVQSDDARVQEMMAEIAEREGLYVPDEFPEYTEDVENDVEFITCPECGHKFPK